MSLSFLVARVQSLEIAIAANTVQEIVGSRPWVPIPGARHEVPGVIAWNGRAVAMLDIARLAGGLRPLSVGECRPRAALIQFLDCALAVPVDSLSEVHTVDDSAVTPRSVHDLPLVRQEIEVGGAVLPLLDPSLLLASSEGHA